MLAFPAGPGRADVRCIGAAAARVLMLDRLDPELTVYPDSGKIGASGGFTEADGARARILNRESENLEYFDGERQ